MKMHLIFHSAYFIYLAVALVLGLAAVVLIIGLRFFTSYVINFALVIMSVLHVYMIVCIIIVIVSAFLQCIQR